MTDYNEQEIDLRPYIEALLKKWYWVVGAGIVGAIIGIAISFLMVPTYEATALVAIIEPRQRVQFDPRIQTVTDNQPLNAYPELALSDELLKNLLDQLPKEYDLTLTRLRRKLEARPGDDPTVLRLTVSDDDPIQAAEMANIWAEFFVKWTNQIYGDQGNEQLVFFEQQFEEAENKLNEAEQAMISFQARNRSNVLQNELLALLQTQSDYHAKQRQTDLILQDIDSLLAKEGGDDHQLAAILLQIRALGGVPNNVETTMPWQIQLNIDGQSNLSQGDQRGLLLGLRETLLAQADQLEESLAELEPQILAVQQEKQVENAEENRLIRDFEVAEETYITVSRKVDEKRITSQDTSSGVKLASRTAVPEFPSGPRKVFIAIGAGLLGALLAILAIIISTWWREN